MNTKFKTFLLATAVTAITMPAMAQDAEKDNPFSVSISGGYSNDSNLTVDAIDSNNQAGDTAFVFEGSAKFDAIDNDDMGFSVGYDFFQSSYNEFHQFDMAIHGFNADGRVTVGRVDYGATYMFNTINLGDSKFLDMHTIRPNVGYLLDNNLVYLLGAYEYQKQNFESIPGRDATRHTGSAKAIFILGEGRTATAGYDWTDHNTNDPGFSFIGHTFDFSLRIPFEILEREATFRTGYRFQKRGFDEESRRYTGAGVRDDKRHTLTASIEVPITAGLFAGAEIEYMAAESNYAVVDFNQTISTVKLGWKY